MTLAELFVRVRGDTTDVDQKLTGVQQKLTLLKGGAEGAHTGVGRLNNAFASMATQIAGVNPVLGKATELIASLGIGSASVVTGALAGLALLAFAWDKLTKSAREATKAQDEAVKRVGATAAGKSGGLDIGELSAKLMALNERRRQAVASVGSSPGGIGLLGADELDTLDAEIENVNNLLILAKKWHAEAVTGSKDHATAIKEVIGKYNELRDAAAKVNAEAMKDNRDWWRNYIERTGEAAEETKRLAEQIAVLTGTDLSSLTAGTAASVSDAVRAAGDNAQKINDAAAQHTQMLRDAIWGSASQLANTIVSALNFGGGGRGSNVGGSIGSTLGFGFGFALGGGPIGGAIGSLIGNIGGSILGGLFDHKKAVETNTQAVRMNTAALIQFAPSGFKIDQYRYGATDVKGTMRDFARYKTRGGIVSLGT